MAQNFTIGEVVRYGWDTTMKNLGFLIAVMVVSFAITGIPNAIAQGLTKDHALLAAPFSLVAAVLQIIIEIGLIKIALKIHDGQKPEFGDLFSGINQFFRFLLGSILVGLIVLGGLILLIVPGIIWALKYQFILYFIVDKQCGVMEALHKSGEITQGKKWDLFLLALALLGVNLLGMCACFVGLLISIPVTFMALVYVYRKLGGELAAAAGPVMEIPPAL